MGCANDFLVGPHLQFEMPGRVETLLFSDTMSIWFVLELQHPDQLDPGQYTIIHPYKQIHHTLGEKEFLPFHNVHKAGLPKIGFSSLPPNRVRIRPTFNCIKRRCFG